MKDAWKEITPSAYPWEREALAFLRDGLPDHEPYRAWSNFEFIADDGSINEVDALILTPKGFFLVEIKSKPGIVEGDAGTWTWHEDGRLVTVDNPLLLANRKAKKLIGLLRRQRALHKESVPFLEALVFLSHEQAQIQLPAYLRESVFLRDRAETTAPDGTKIPSRPGILSALRTFTADKAPRRRIDRRIAAAITRAMSEAGIRASMASRRVGDFELQELLFEGPGYQDWSARNVALEADVCRARIYGVETGASEETRRQIAAAARREYELLRGIHHDGILRARHYTVSERGPVLFFEHDPESRRLDHYLAEQGSRLTVDQKLGILRQIAEIVRYAHDRRLLHRALAPQNVLVKPSRPGASEGATPKVQVFNWQTGALAPSASRTVSVAGASSPSTHVDELVEDATRVYLAPEVVAERAAPAPQQDVFSLGAFAYRLFAGVPPAKDYYELREKLRSGGLQLSDAVDGVAGTLQLLVETATQPLVHDRLDSAAEFLAELENVENELTDPHEGEVLDPTTARKGDRLPGGFVVEKILGRGASSVALLVRRPTPKNAARGKGDGTETVVLKVALDPSHNERLRAEAEVLGKLRRHSLIVQLLDTAPIGDRFALVLDQAGDETLAQRLRRDGRLHLELLERFGDDLLQTVDWLEQEGVSHRDIKPENLGIMKLGKGGRLRLVLFDFSLSRTPPENIEAGTVAYRDPFLADRKPKPRWDGYAERWSAAITLYEMATASHPTWGDEASDPSLDRVEATIEPEAFEPALRERMTGFFQKALRREPSQRFDNADEMRTAWRAIFAGVGLPATPSDHPSIPARDEHDRPVLPDDVALGTPLVLLGLSTRALNALDRVGAETVEDFLRTSVYHLNRLRGVGGKTRREIAQFLAVLNARFPDVERRPPEAAPATGAGAAERPDYAALSVDAIARQLVPSRGSKQAEATRRTERLFLRLELPAEGSSAPGALGPPWPSQSDVARETGLTRARIGQILARARARWRDDPALSALREELVAILDGQGQVMTGDELADAVLARRGSAQEEPLRSRWAAAAVRAALECERDLANPRFVVRRLPDGGRILVARDEVVVDAAGNARPRIDGHALADYAERLGRRADELADADPLLPPERVREALLGVRPPGDGAPLPEARLLRLAAAASSIAALSSRLELYPSGMPAKRALTLAAGALAGPTELTLDEIRQRVLGRYPESEPLPDDPQQVAELLRAIGSERVWNETTTAFREPPPRTFTTIETETSLQRRLTPHFEPAPAERITVQQFDRRLRSALERRQFLALVVRPQDARLAEQALAAELGLDTQSLDQLLIAEMRAFAASKKVDWQTVLRADAGGPEARDGGDWRRLLLVVQSALPKVFETLAGSERPILLTNPGLLARYDQLAFLGQLQEATGRADGLPGLWLLVPGDEQQAKPTVGGKPVPVYTRAQWDRIPREWLASWGARGAVERA